MQDYSCLRTFEGSTASVLSVRFLSRGMQILSGSADGLVRLWNVGSGECGATLDEHEDKVWALCVPSEAHHQALRGTHTSTSTSTSVGGHDGADGDAEPPGLFISGGGDSCIRVWRDCTREQEQQRLLEQEQALVHAQELENDVSNRRYGKVSPLFSFSPNSPLPVLALPLSAQVATPQ